MKAKMNSRTWLVTALVAAMSLSPVSLAEDNSDATCDQAVGQAAEAAVESGDLQVIADAVTGALGSQECTGASDDVITSFTNVVTAMNALAADGLVQVSQQVETTTDDLPEQPGQDIVDLNGLGLNGLAKAQTPCPPGQGAGTASLYLVVAGSHRPVNVQPAIGDFEKLKFTDKASFMSPAYGVSGVYGVVTMFIAGIPFVAEHGGQSAWCGSILSDGPFGTQGVTKMTCGGSAYGYLESGTTLNIRISGTGRAPACT